jgi:hypothetical protein
MGEWGTRITAGDDMSCQPSVSDGMTGTSQHPRRVDSRAMSGKKRRHGMSRTPYRRPIGDLSPPARPDTPPPQTNAAINSGLHEIPVKSICMAISFCSSHLRHVGKFQESEADCRIQAAHPVPGLGTFSCCGGPDGPTRTSGRSHHFVSNGSASTRAPGGPGSG